MIEVNRSMLRRWCLLVLLSFSFGCDEKGLEPEAEVGKGDDFKPVEANRKARGREADVVSPEPGLSSAGEALASQFSCAACHKEPDPLLSRIPLFPAPNLESVGGRLAPEYLRSFLASPHDIKPGTKMPDVLHGFSGTDRADVVEDLIHFLQSKNGPFVAEPVTVRSSFLDHGRRLYETVGCVACHEVDSSERLSKATALDPLTAFLVDPLLVRPSGQMPSMRLTEDEARSVAFYLLRHQADDLDLAPDCLRRPGLEVEYFEGEFDGKDGTFAGKEPIALDISFGFTIDLPRKDDGFGFRFRGEIEVPTDGEYTFYTTSDDGSWLYIYDQLVVDNGGSHGPIEKSGWIELSAGRHPITVTMFEGEGGEALFVEYEGPTFDRGPIPMEVLSHRPVTMIPPDVSGFELDPVRIAKGAVWFESLGCQGCHDPGRSPVVETRPFLELLSEDSGCLSENPPDGVPRFDFQEGEKEQLQALVKAREELSHPRSASEEIDFVLSRLDCLSCHERDSAGGPVESLRPMFTGIADLGDEGRIPPTLSGVGHRLKKDWIRRVLTEKGAARPYMNTRMPEFGVENVAALSELFDMVDSLPGDDEEPEYSAELAEIGRMLVGRRGMICINCHYYGGHGQRTAHALDLAETHSRVKPVWHADLLKNPQETSPGTRMPPYWIPGRVDFPDVLAGDTDRQVEAIRVFLSLEGKGPPPHGLEYDKMKYDLVPKEEPIVFGAFMKGLSARVMAVGHPEEVHFAFDAHNIRLARMWRGGFINSEGTWHDRAGKLESPDSADVLTLPPGSPLARLSDPSDPWPELFGREAGFRMRGVKRDELRRPIFLYRYGDLMIEESLTPDEVGERVGLVRRIKLSTESEITDLSFRMIVAGEIKEEANFWFATDEGCRVRLREGRATIRSQGETQELVMPVRISREDPKTLEIEVQYQW